MSVSVNRIILAGNLTRDPELKFFANEKCVANLGLACNRKFRDGNGEQKEEVLFIDVEAWGRTAELAGQYLTKGKPVLIEGRLKMDEWEDKASGAKRSKIKILADSIQFLGSRDDAAGSGQAPAAPRSEAPQERPRPVGGPSYDDDEPPF